jgi:hypothetical protein
MVESLVQPVSTLGIILLSTGFVYSMIVSWLAYRQTGKQWMLFLPQWIDASSGVTRRLRIHGIAAFTLLIVAMMVFFYELS